MGIIAHLIKDVKTQVGLNTIPDRGGNGLLGRQWKFELTLQTNIPRDLDDGREIVPKDLYLYGEKGLLECAMHLKVQCLEKNVQ